jgi:hypothetical protein
MRRYFVPVLFVKAYREIRGIAPLIRHLDTRWRWAVNFTPQPLCFQGENHGTHWVWAGWATESEWTCWGKENFLVQPGIERRAIQSVAGSNYAMSRTCLCRLRFHFSITQRSGLAKRCYPLSHCMVEILAFIWNCYYHVWRRLFTV